MFRMTGLMYLWQLVKLLFSIPITVVEDRPPKVATAKTRGATMAQPVILPILIGPFAHFKQCLPPRNEKCRKPSQSTTAPRYRRAGVDP